MKKALVLRKAASSCAFSKTKAVTAKSLGRSFSAVPLRLLLLGAATFCRPGKNPNSRNHTPCNVGEPAANYSKRCTLTFVSHGLLAGEGLFLFAAVLHQNDGSLEAGDGKGHVLFNAFAE